MASNFLLQGPILGGVFGLAVKDKTLWRLGVKNETISLGICLLVGKLVLVLHV